MNNGTNQNRLLKIFFGLMIMAVFCLLIFWLFETKFHRFKGERTKYHSDFAIACDSILAHYPLGTDKFIEVSVTDPSLPDIIGHLHPQKIKVSTNWVWILVDDSHTDGLVIIWEPEDDPHHWHLVATTGEGPTETIYVTTR